tara:strand:+ start:1630 stop:1869 length:240 start_codon:yes stop_codon:yes gene_type:complete
MFLFFNMLENLSFMMNLNFLNYSYFKQKSRHFKNKTLKSVLLKFTNTTRPQTQSCKTCPTLCQVEQFTQTLRDWLKRKK